MAANKRENFGNKSSEQRKKLAQNCFSFRFFHGKVLLSLKAQRVSKEILATNHIFFPISKTYFKTLDKSNENN